MQLVMLGCTLTTKSFHSPQSNMRHFRTEHFWGFPERKCPLGSFQELHSLKGLFSVCIYTTDRSAEVTHCKPAGGWYNTFIFALTSQNCVVHPLPHTCSVKPGFHCQSICPWFLQFFKKVFKRAAANFSVFQRCKCCFGCVQPINIHLLWGCNGMRFSQYDNHLRKYLSIMVSQFYRNIITISISGSITIHVHHSDSSSGGSILWNRS